MILSITQMSCHPYDKTYSVFFSPGYTLNIYWNIEF